jgi:hypothetical protein
MVDIYDCPACAAHLHRPLLHSGNQAKTKPGAVQPQEQKAVAEENACPECVFADDHCSQCGDSVCEKHIRCATGIAGSLSAELRDHLLEQYGNQIFCPLCFQGKMMRLSREIGQGGSRSKPKKLFNMPLILVLFALVFLITLGPKRCVAEHLNQQESATHESPPGSP